jgi:hypothetical protein
VQVGDCVFDLDAVALLADQLLDRPGSILDDEGFARLSDP